MGKLQTLKPRVSALNTLRVNTLSTRTDRITGRPLQRRNRRYLREHPLCAGCEPRGVIRAAVEVDHKVPLHRGGLDEEGNLQGLCFECHKSKTSKEARDRIGSSAAVLDAQKVDETWRV